MKPGFVFITERYVRPDRDEKLCDDSIPVPDFYGFNMPKVTVTG